MIRRISEGELLAHNPKNPEVYCTISAVIYMYTYVCTYHSVAAYAASVVFPKTVDDSH